MLRLAPNGCVDAINGRVENGECPDYSVLSNFVPAPDSPRQWVPRPAASVLASTYTVPGGLTFVVLTSGSTWTVPANWNNASNAIWALGAGGNGGTASQNVYNGAGGGGGAFASVANKTLTPGASINIQVGVNDGTTGSGTTPTANTWFNNSSTLVAAGGASASGSTQGAAGSTANSVGTVKYAGGAGGSSGGSTAGGGGGAGGPNGAGGAGQAVTTTGANGGTGDNSHGGAGASTLAGVGAAGTEWAPLTAATGVGSGGGGGGTLTPTNQAGGAGGAYGAAGGGGSGTGASWAGGAGAGGVIVIAYNASPLVYPMPGITCQVAVGNFFCGMMNDPEGSGTDIPFVFNLLNSTFLTVSGINTATNCPTSPSAGDWQPPHAEPIGNYVLISHSGFSGTGSNFYGAIGLSLSQLPKTIVINSGVAWVTPADWNNASNQIQVIGSGANGGPGGNGQGGSTGGAGGAGGGYASLSNVTLAGTNTIQIGSAGTPTWFNASTNLQAAGGSSGSNVASGAFGSSAVTFAGGAAAGASGDAGGGGGGAAGPAGVGGAGGLNGGAGDAGTGGAGGVYGSGAGSPGSELGSSGVGSGGGGGGGGGGHGAGSNGYNGGAGGAYGAGGGGGGNGYSSRGAGGLGAGGVIIVTYTPAPIPAAWTVQNTLTNVLPSPPVWITQFNSRAWFLCNPGGTTPPAALCSDVLGVASGPLSRSAAVAGVIITFGDTVPLVGAGTLSLTNISTGGVTQAMYVFKAATQGMPNIYQITGDIGTTNLSSQALNAGVSTVAPNSIISTPLGLFFVAPDGLRYIDTQGHVQPPIGYAGTGKVTQFLNAAPQSRISGACNANTMRFALYNSISGNVEDWCYDLVRQSWYGPHTFPAGLVTALGPGFIITPYVGTSVSGIYYSTLVPSAASTYIELALPMTCTATSSIIPDRKEMNELATVRSLLYAGVPAGGTTYNVSIQDINGNVLGTTAFATPTTVTNVSPSDITWAAPIVFDRAAVKISVTGTAGVRLGSFQLPVSQSGFTSRAPGN